MEIQGFDVNVGNYVICKFNNCIIRKGCVLRIDKETQKISYHEHYKEGGFVVSNLEHNKTKTLEVKTKEKDLEYFI